MKPDAIVLHHSLTEDTRTVSWAAIRHYHTSWKCEGVAIAKDAVNDLINAGMPVEKPWSDIGYHFGIEDINGRFEILVGRMMNEPGAHCTQQNMNRRSLGICFVGCFDVEPPPAGQWMAGVRLVRSLMAAFEMPVGRIFGHRELAPYKSCPGRAFDLRKFRTEVSNG
jgi:hypothetical protein